MKKTLGVAVALIIGATQVQAQIADKVQACEMSGVFVGQAVDARVAGLTEKEAKAAIKGTITENAFMWSLVLGPLVKQVYELPVENMTPEFVEKFVAACIEQ